MKLIDLTGQRFGRLVVLERAKETKNKHVQWICQCDCDSEPIAIVSQRLRNGITQSCGCLKRDLLKESRTIDEIGNKYGLLTVIARAESFGTNGAKWLCRCKCGNEKIYTGKELRYGRIESCGCLASKGEAKIINVLNENNIRYITQFSFKDLISDKNRVLRFDFAVIENRQLLYLIEYQGIQHYESRESGPYIKENCQRLSQHDVMKKRYCIKNNIPLIIIPYTHYSKLCIEDLTLKSKFIYKGEEDE